MHRPATKDEQAENENEVCHESQINEAKRGSSPFPILQANGRRTNHGPQGVRATRDSRTKRGWSDKKLADRLTAVNDLDGTADGSHDLFIGVDLE